MSVQVTDYELFLGCLIIGTGAVFLYLLLYWIECKIKNRLFKKIQDREKVS